MIEEATSAHWQVRERLWPSAGVWVVALLLGAGAGVVAGPLLGEWAVLAAAVTAGVLIGVLGVTSPVVGVRDGELVAGRARVPLRYLGSSTTYVGDAARAQRGPDLDARAYLLLRGWIDPVVRVEVRDEADPTPYWLISTRRPEALVDALAEHRRGEH